MTTNNYATAVRGYRDELGAAMQYTDTDLAPEAIATRKRARVHAARQALLAARPVLPQNLPSRDGVIASLRPKTADEIARVQYEAAKVQALLERGQPLAQIIANADETRALAIADLVETLPQVLDPFASTLDARLGDMARSGSLALDVKGSTGSIVATGSGTTIVNNNSFDYHAAENRALSSEEELFAALGSPRSPFGAVA